MKLAERLKLDTVDARFRCRPARFARPDPRIAIVDIDQNARELLGRRPFSRTYFAKLLDALHQDGAALAAFEVAFSRPDQTAAPVRSLAAALEHRPQNGNRPTPG